MTRIVNTIMPSSKSSMKAQRGVSMIDAMIALVVFSVGLLAIAALQVLTKQSNYEAMQRSYAASMAYDLYERMRMNSDRDATNSALSYYANSSTAITLTWSTPLTEPVLDCGSANCEYSAMAAWDLYEWQQALLGANEVDNSGGYNAGGLFDPTACISGPGAGASGEYTITIAWRGQTALPDTHASNTCGAGDYDQVSGDNAFRRIMVVNAYLEN